MKILVITSILTAFAITGIATAQTSSGTLGVTANVQGSLNMTFATDSAGLAMTGTTTSAGSLPFGNVSMYSSTVPANVTKTVIPLTSFDLATPFDVRVDLANSPSATYTLAAILAAADTTNTWKLGALALSGTTASVTVTGAYATAVPYTLHLTVPATAVAGAISNTINFTATAN
ncbi:MAG: hypothetical protein ABSC93_03415 [Bryobacteraceae bacterium]|jgi:hypothetical protein